jgi:hypothetical protein
MKPACTSPSRYHREVYALRALLGPPPTGRAYTRPTVYAVVLACAKLRLVLTIRSVYFLSCVLAGVACRWRCRAVRLRVVRFVGV